MAKASRAMPGSVRALSITALNSAYGAFHPGPFQVPPSAQCQAGPSSQGQTGTATSQGADAAQPTELTVYRSMVSRDLVRLVAA